MKFEKISQDQITELFLNCAADHQVRLPDSVRVDMFMHYRGIEAIRGRERIAAFFSEKTSQLTAESKRFQNFYAPFVTTHRSELREALVNRLDELYPMQTSGIHKREERQRRQAEKEKVLKPVRETLPTPAKPRIRSWTDAGECLKEYLTTLTKGKTWRLEGLKASKSSKGIRGSCVYDYLASHGEGGFCEASIRMALGDEADRLLTRNPFERARKLQSDDDARKYLQEFFRTLKPGEVWNAERLSERFTAKDGLKGETLYEWVRINVPGGFSLEGLEYLFGKEAVRTLFRKNPFHKMEFRINSPEAAADCLVEFLKTRAAGSEWCTTDLFGWTGRDGTTGKALERWLRKHLKGGFTARSLSKFLGDRRGLLESRPLNNQPGLPMRLRDRGKKKHRRQVA